MNSISSISSQITSNIFSKLDTNNQGYIDQTALSKAFSNLSDTESSDLMSSLDTDGDSKITKSELSKGIENLLSQLNSASSNGMQGMPPPPHGDIPPPPPPDGANDEGFTKDQLTEISSSTNDSKLSELMKSISENFDAADTNQDGKVNGEEAHAFQESQQVATNNNSSLNNSSASLQQAALNRIAELIQAYGLSSVDNTNSISSTA